MRTRYLAVVVGLLATSAWSLAQSQRSNVVVLGPAPAETSPAPMTWDGASCCCCSCCCPEPARLLSVNAQYLLWWTKGSPLSVPLATGDRNDQLTPTAGGLADPNTIVLLGNETIAYDVQSGFRGMLGLRLNECWSVEAGGFFLEEGEDSRFLSSQSLGRAIIFRPIIGIRENRPPPFNFAPNAGKFVSSTLDDLGSLTVNFTNSFWGTEANLVQHFARGPRGHLDLLVGFRNLNLSEDINVIDLSTLVQDGVGFFLGEVFDTQMNPAFVGDQFNVFERIAAYNHFYGGQIGFRGEVRRGRLGVGGSYKLGLGGTQQTVKEEATSVHISASTGAVETAPGGLLVQPFNIGSHSNSEFSVVNEVQVEISYYLQRDALRLFFGYDFLHWTNVARPGEQISLVINDTQGPISPAFNVGGLVGPLVPTIDFNQADFWAQGLHFGVELTY